MKKLIAAFVVIVVLASVCCACGRQVDEREGYLEYEGHKCCAILYVPSGTTKVKEVYGYVADEDLERYQSGDRDFSMKVLHPFDPDQWSVIDAKTISKITANYYSQSYRKLFS